MSMLPESGAGWAWFDPSPNDTEPGNDAQIADSFARIFRGADGEAAIAYLRAVTLDRALGPRASDATLRHLEGQRQLVCHVLALIERGRNPT